jgi:1-acyl-sn-glycerol-3-phosphate acyltransferase
MPKSHVTQFLYHSFVGLIRMYSRFAWDFRVSGGKRVPLGPKIYVANHIVSVDPYWVMMAVPEFLHIVIGPPFGVRWLAPVFRSFEQINAMPQHRKAAVSQACHYLALGESVYIAPEGDVQPPFQLGHFYSGLAKIHRQSLAPIVPVALAVSPENIRRHPKWDMKVDDRTYEARMVWRGKVRVMIGEALTPTLRHDVDEEEDNRRITEEVRASIATMLSELAPEFDDSVPS